MGQLFTAFILVLVAAIHAGCAGFWVARDRGVAKLYLLATVVFILAASANIGVAYSSRPACLPAEAVSP